MKLQLQSWSPLRIMFASLAALSLLAACSTTNIPVSGTALPCQMKLASDIPQAPAKATSVPPLGDANQVTTLGYHIDGFGDYNLTWRYRLLGDYNLTLNVDVSDITPIAMHFGETWDPLVNPDSAASVVDGSGNYTVGVEDITQIAMNYNRRCVSYRVEGSTAIDGTYTEVGNAPCPAASMLDLGWPEIAFNLGAAPAYEWYRVVPIDNEGTAGIESIPVHFVPGGGGGLIISLVSAPESGAGLEANPFVILTGTAYEIAVEDEHGNPITEGIEVHVQPPFLAEATSTTPFTITHTGTLTGDFYVYVTSGSLISNRLYFRIPGLP